jgi:hypothetical protein
VLVVVSAKVTIPAGTDRCQGIYKELAKEFSCDELGNYLSLFADYKSCVAPKYP